MALRYELATYDPDTYLVGDEIVFGSPTFAHADTIYAKCADGYYHSFSANKRVVKNGRYADEDTVYADNGSGTLLDPLPMTVYQKDAENIVYYSTALSDSHWAELNATVSQDVTSLLGAANTAYSITDATTGAIGSLKQTSLTTSGVGVFKIWIEKDASYERNVRITRVNNDIMYLKFSPKDGTVYDNNEGSNTVALEVIDDGDCWLIMHETASSSNTGVQIYPAYGYLPITNSGSAAATGTIGVKQVEFLVGLTLEEAKHIGPVFTTGTSESTDEIINTYPSANWSNSEGPIYIEFDYTGEDQNILLNDDVPILYVTSDVLYLDDGTNTASIACSTVGEHKVGIALDSSGGNMRLNLDGTWSD